MTVFIRPGGERPTDVRVPNDPQLLDPLDAETVVVPGVVEQVVDAQTVIVGCKDPLPDTVRAEIVGTGTCTVGDTVMVYGYRKGPMEYWWVAPASGAEPPKPVPPALSGVWPLDQETTTAACFVSPNNSLAFYSVMASSAGTPRLAAWELTTGESNVFTNPSGAAAINPNPPNTYGPRVFPYRDSVAVWTGIGTEFWVLDGSTGGWGTLRRVTIPAGPLGSSLTRGVVGQDDFFYVFDAGFVHTGTTVSDEDAAYRVVVRRLVTTTNAWTGTWVTVLDQTGPSTKVASGAVSVDTQLDLIVGANGKFGVRGVANSKVAGNPFDYLVGASGTFYNGVSDLEWTGNHILYPQGTQIPRVSGYFKNATVPVDADSDYTRALLGGLGTAGKLSVWRWDGTKFGPVGTVLNNADYYQVARELNPLYCRYFRIGGDVMIACLSTADLQEMHVIVIDVNTGGSSILFKIPMAGFSQAQITCLTKFIVWGGATLGWGGSTFITVPNESFDPRCLAESAPGPFDPAFGYNLGWDLYQVTY